MRKSVARLNYAQEVVAPVTCIPWRTPNSIAMLRFIARAVNALSSGAAPISIKSPLM